MQRYPLISSTQVAPKAQGEDWHSLISMMGRRGNRIVTPQYPFVLSGKTKHRIELPTGALCSFSSVYWDIDSCLQHQYNLRKVL